MARSHSPSNDPREPSVLDFRGHTSESDIDPSSDSNESSRLEQGLELTRPPPGAREQSSFSVNSAQQLGSGKTGAVDGALRARRPADASSLKSPSLHSPGSNSASHVAPSNTLTLRRAYNSDGRVRDPTPAKFLGRPNDHGGNFMVVNFLLDKKMNSEADAKQTSERTAAIAAAANAKGYSSLKRHAWEGDEQPALPKTSTMASPNLRAPPALSSQTLQAEPSQTWAPPPPPAPQEQQQQTPEPLLKRKRGRPRKNVTVQTPSAAPMSIQPVPRSSQAYPTASQQGYGALEGSPAFAPTNPALSSHPSLGASPGLSPHSTKVEQARLLTLLRSINPSVVVDNLCKGVAYFGGIPGAPPPTDGSFPKSARNGSGHQLISWVAELFPDGEKCPAYGKATAYPPPVIPQSTPQSKLPERFPSPDQLSAPNYPSMQSPLTTAPPPHSTEGVVPSLSSSTPVKVPKKRGRPWGSKSSVFRSDKGKKRGPVKKKDGETPSRSTNTGLPEIPAQHPAATESQSSEWQPTRTAPTSSQPSGQPYRAAVASMDLTPTSKHPSTHGRNQFASAN